MTRSHHTRTLLATLLLLTLTLGAPQASAVMATTKSVADCAGDPCAATRCTSTTASAHAVGSEHAWASARSGGFESAADGPGSAHADATGPGPTSASAHGKRDWSLKEAKASCSGGSTVHTAEGFSLGCVANDKITSSESFGGRVYVSALGELVVFDAARGLALPLASLEVTLDGESLQGLVALDVSGMTALPYAIGVTFLDGGDGGAKECAAKLNGA